MLASMRHGEELRHRIRANLERFAVRELPQDGLKRAAVAVCLVPDREGDASFLLTRRVRSLRRHGGQWALPGGRLDPQEEPEQAARRELEEELGIAAAALVLLGRLDDFATRSGFLISPLVLWSAEPVTLRPDPAEVERAYHVKLRDLDRPDVPILTTIPESERPVLSMPILGQRVHEPTAAILYQLLEVALRGQDTRVGHYEQPVFAWR